VLDGLMFAHQLVERIAVEASHEDREHPWARPPNAIFVTLWKKQSCWETDGNGLPSSGTLKPNKFSDAVS
jgi:hypothetical protein